MFDRAEFVDKCPQRANMIEWLPFKAGQSVVIHSSAPSAVIDMMRAKEVQLQVMSEAHIEKLAMNPGKGSLDYVVLLGMEVNARILAGLHRKLKPEGRLVVLLHNKFGMSYLAGKPAYEEQYYAEVEGKGASNKKCSFYSYNGISKLFENAGIPAFSRYYLDPDGDFAVNIYSDAYLPKAGDCNKKTNNFTYDRLAMFDEVRATNQAVQEEMYPVFVNDYLLVTGETLPQVMVRYSNDRAAEYQIKTEICNINDNLEVRKTPLHPQGAEHVQRMEQTYAALCEQYDGSVFRIVQSRWNGKYTIFPFVKGVTLSELMQQALQKGDLDTVYTLFNTFLNKLQMGKVMNFTNYDFIFSNIIIDNNIWQVVDYEWTVNKPVTAEELAFRAAYCFYLEHKEFPFDDICRILGFNNAKVQQLISQETSYQHSITGEQASAESLCSEYGGDVYTKEQLLRNLELSTADSRVQIYEDSGNGFLEEQSYFVEHAHVRHDEMELTLDVVSGVKALRIDPCDEPCLIQIKKLWWNNQEQYLEKQILVNGVKGKGSKNSYAEYIFATRDPNFTISLDKLPESSIGQNELKLQLEIHKISLQLANTLTKSIKRII